MPFNDDIIFIDDTNQVLMQYYKNGYKHQRIYRVKHSSVDKKKVNRWDIDNNVSHNTITEVEEMTLSH